MNTGSRKTLTLGDLIEAAFDRARTVTSDPKVAAGLAARTVARCLARTGRSDLIRLLTTQAPRRGSGRPASYMNEQARAA